MKVSLIISVYKDLESLTTILEALRFQTFSDFEIVVSEDGEWPVMKEFLARYQHSNPIVHLTQPDVGWRKNQALNNAIRKSTGDYLVFIDGDCVPHHKFIENHVKFSADKVIVAGRRVKLGTEYTRLFKTEIHNLFKLERKVVWDFFKMKNDGARFYEEGIYVDPDSLAASFLKKRKFRTMKGCNMSFFKKDILAINGFDEDYQLPAIGEDIDLIWRFKGVGSQFVSVKNFAVQYHLHHKENWTDNSFNENLMFEKMRKMEYVCRNGIVKLS
jgi:glycosyltransferase involved in cell wall biosynthesis